MVSEFSAYIKALAAVFTSELGDKTMISTATAAIAFKKAWLILLISVLGYVTANIGPLFALTIVKGILQEHGTIVRIIVGLGFIVMGLVTVMKEEKEEPIRSTSLLSYYALVTLAEFGDKTQLATIGVAMNTGKICSTLAFGTIGYLLANSISVSLATLAGHKINYRILKMVAGILFILMGILALLGY